jgi:hypothetical protein
VSLEPSGRVAQRGAVLVFVVLFMMALIGLGHGLLVASLGEEAASRAASRQLVARAAADGAVRLALRATPAVWMDSVPVGGSRVGGSARLGPVDTDVTLQRLTRESWLIQGRARFPGGIEVRSARLAWRYDPLDRIESLAGVLTTAAGASWSLAGVVDASAPVQARPPLDPADCAPWQSALETHYAGSALALADVVPSPPDDPSLGLLDFASLLDAAEIVVTGAGTPAPVEALGGCLVDAPWGWGDPEEPSRPCGPHLPLRGGVGHVAMVGGVGQGMLVVDGDLDLTTGARYFGLVVVSGTLRLDAGASLDGMALAGTGVTVAAGARVQGSACWAVRALAAQRGRLGRLFAAPGVGALGPL